VINLDERLDRLSWSKSQAAKFHFEFHRCAAVSSHNLDFEFVTSNVGACFESHRLVWKAIAESDSEYGLVLEDDFEFEKLDLVSLSQILDDTAFDLIQIGFLNTGYRDKFDYVLTNFKHLLLLLVKVIASKFGLLQILSRPLVHEVNTTFPQLVPANFRAGAHAYIVSRRMAESVVHMNSPVFLATDDFLMALSRMRTFKMYRFLRSGCRQTSLPTSIVNRFKNLH
jgi:GR25 family glycosyltransferase involved in LPS biosynthesis